MMAGAGVLVAAVHGLAAMRDALLRLSRPAGRGAGGQVKAKQESLE